MASPDRTPLGTRYPTRGALRASVLGTPEGHLAAADSVLAGLIAAHGPCTLAPAPDLFAALAGAIVGQQLSIKAAGAIRGRLVEALPGGRLAPEAILAAPETTLRGAGLSGAKTAAIRDLAGRVAGGALDLAGLAAQPDEAVIAALLPVRGIGRWTAEMFLIFALGRPDVLPVGDLGLRTAVARAYGLPELPAAPATEAIAAPWRPYRSVATWYLWRSLNNAP